MTSSNDQTPPEETCRRYKWPWFVWGAVVLAVLLAVLWMSQEVARLQKIREANSPGPDSNTAAPASPRP